MKNQSDTIKQKKVDVSLSKNIVQDSRFIKRLATGAVAFVLIVAGLILSIRLGAVNINITEIVTVLSGDITSTNYHIIWNIRLPRIIVGALVGANLAIAGAILQCILRNPLADPGIIGVSAGAGFSALVIMILMPEKSHLVPFGAFIGAISATILVYGISWKGGIQPMKLILAGVAVSALFGAGMTALMVFHSDKVQGTINWIAGGFQGRSWEHVKMIIPYTIVGIMMALLGFRYLNILMLGDDVARSLGIRVEVARSLFIVLASLLSASAVSAAGLLGFVGLITPHVVRILIGSDHKYLLPLSVLIGSALVIYADTVARIVFNPVEIPVGVFMAFLGAPFFLYLLRKREKRNG